MATQTDTLMQNLDFEDFKKIVLTDFRIACESRQTSLLGRKEVLSGKAKFGIFGDGKEVAQIAMAKAFKNGDFRSGYYRDQTFMMAINQLSIQEYFAGLYGHLDITKDPMSGGRQMGGHFSTALLNPDGSFKIHINSKNSAADSSPTASQMPRLLGLGYASHFYKNNPELQKTPFLNFSNCGEEIAFGTIGDASTSEGLFWESLNAAGVLQVPIIMSVWDDGYGISVQKKHQTIKESISEALKGFQKDLNKNNGFEIFKTKGWDYAHLCETYYKAEKICREQHIPVLIHVEELTQVNGHSTSGSHERYKSKDRLEWERDHDCIKCMKEWMLAAKIADTATITKIEEDAINTVKEAKNKAWSEFQNAIKNDLQSALSYLINLHNDTNTSQIEQIVKQLQSIKDPIQKDIHQALHAALRLTNSSNTLPSRQALAAYLKQSTHTNVHTVGSHLHSQSSKAVKFIQAIAPIYNDPKKVDAREILRDNFDIILNKYPEVLIFGEDAGKIGGVNQTLEGLQTKYGIHRVFDTGIREATIVGQAIGLAMRGLRPIAEIQYLDYLLYALQTMSDDLATLHWRTAGLQKAPVIISTRGHRLEGVWHSGSPLGMIIHSCRGINICVPRNMTKAAAFYNTLLQSDEPAVVIEPLNAYRLKESMPSNLEQMCEALGIPEIVERGTDVTLVTYGSTLRIAQDAIEHLKQFNISVELIDVQTLLPFDVNHTIVQSVKHTHRVVFLDEDVEGGATAYMMQQVLEVQNAYQYLDSKPVTITAKPHRPAYGTDGDYFSKPNADEIFSKLYQLMHETNPNQFPLMF